MQKPCRLELQNEGRWTLVAKFDAAIADDVDDILNSAAGLAGALASATGKRLPLRVCSDETPPSVLMQLQDPLKGWRPVRAEDQAA